MKSYLKLLLLFFLGINLFAVSCNSSNTSKTNPDTSNNVIDSMPVDTTSSGDTAIVVDTVR